MTAGIPRPGVFDQVTLICNGCKTERQFYPDAPWTAEQLIEYLKTRATSCPNCDATTCDVKARMTKEAADAHREAEKGEGTK